MEYLDRDGGKYLATKLKSYVDNKVTDLPSGGTVDLTNYYTKEETNALIPSVEGLATKTYVDENIAKVATGGEIDLSNYVTKDTVYTKAQTDALIPSVPSKVSELENDSNYLSSIPEEYVTDTELNAKGYLTEHQDLSAYALKTEIPTVPSLDGYATTEYVDNAIANVPTGGNVDLSNYYTKNETYSKTEVDTLVANSGGSSGGGSAITYAYDTEIATGETWIDGKPIYLKVFHINGSSSQPSSSIIFSSYKEQNKFAETIVSVIPVWKSGSRVITGNTIDITDMVSNVTSANDNIVQRTLNCWVDNDAKFTINISKGKRVYSFGCDVFVKYTKL